MDKKIKVALYISGAILGLIIIVFIYNSFFNNQFNSEIPEVSDSQTLSLPVKEQISGAFAKAQNDPSAENLGMLGMVYHSSANYELAAQCYKLAINRKKSGWIWNYYLGYLSMEMGESDAVIENFKRVLKKNPKIDLAWYYIGEEYKNQRKNKLAEETFNKITTQKDKISSVKKSVRYDNFSLSTYAMFQLSRLYFDTGRTDLSEKTLLEIIQKNRSFGPAYRLLGNIYSMNGDTVLSKWNSERASDLISFSPPVDTLVDKLVLLSRSELYLLKKIDEAELS
ncbi:MAG: hypothetical protein HQ541_22405, partial [Mariniphaga sp.]|nr:hypothetical protein [Mariniphaga sp.]